MDDPVIFCFFAGTILCFVQRRERRRGFLPAGAWD